MNNLLNNKKLMKSEQKAYLKGLAKLSNCI
jgi:hypothetical protein